MLRYQGHSIALQEVPGEISLALQIANCPHRCEGCHSPELREDIGRPLANDLLDLLMRYRGMISCVCFMGEGSDLKALKRHLSIIQMCGLNTCLYSGCDEIGDLAPLIPHLDYLKIGSYRLDRGDLASANTNQRFYAVVNGNLDDVTHQFQRKRDM